MTDEWQDIATLKMEDDKSVLIWIPGKGYGIARQRHGIAIINDRFAFDMPQPTLWAELLEPPK